MDAALRAAERTYASDPTPEHRALLKAERARAGQPDCASCGDEPSRHVDGSGDAVCDDCYASNLRDGHREGMHDDEPCDDCPLC